MFKNIKKGYKLSPAMTFYLSNEVLIQRKIFLLVFSGFQSVLREVLNQCFIRCSISAS